MDLTGWHLADAVDYKFPSGTTIEPGEYLVVSGGLCCGIAHLGLPIARP
jgi:hypothetical protein